MPLRVKAQAEPFTDFSKGTEPILATSEVYIRLRRDLERYTNGLIQGRSYLIGGHRGSGKTTLIYKAIEDLIRSSLNYESRPLFVRLHGPDLLPPIIEISAPVQPANPASPATGTALGVGAEAETTLPGSLTVNTAPLSEDAKRQVVIDKELDTILKQMVKALYRDVSNEFRRCYREAVLRLPEGVRRTDLLEVAAQFDFEVADYVTPSRLRTFWHRIGCLSRGILFTADRSKYRLYTPANAVEPAVLAANDVGLQEILAFSFLSRAFRLTTGTMEDVQKKRDEEKGERSTTLSTAYELKNLFAPIAGLLSGGFVGYQMFQGNPFSAVLLGLVTGAVVSFAFSFKSVRSSSNQTSLESVFKRDTSIASLSSVLPLLVIRLRQIGLAPVFVIDELDKVPDLTNRMVTLVRHLKFLVTENSFSCFLTDRRYLTYLNQKATESAYAPESSYFSDRLAILYRPGELRGFVKEVLEIVAAPGETAGASPTQTATQLEKDQEELEKISYLLLHRARLHPIDLRRQIDSLIARDQFSIADAFSAPRYRFEILIEVAIEWLLDGEDMQARLSANPAYRQVAYDALYYISRLWEDAGADDPQIPGFTTFLNEANEKKPGVHFNEENFSAYLLSRSEVEDRDAQTKSSAESSNGEKVNAGKPKPVTGKDFEFLCQKVLELLRYLCDPDDLLSDIQRSSRQNKPPIFVLNEIPRTASLRLLEYEKGTQTFRWLYDASGNYLHNRDVLTIVNEVGDATFYIRELIALLSDLGVTGDIQALADAKIIPRPTDWKEGLLPALDRLDQLRADGDLYANMNVDRGAVLEFDNTLQEFQLNIKAALMSAAIFAPEVKALTPGTQFFEALKQVALALNLSANAVEDSNKLLALLNSYSPNPPVENWTLDQIKEFVLRTINQPPAPPEAAEEIVAVSWKRTQERFSKRVQDGTDKFDAEYPDVFTAIKKVGAGYELGTVFSTITAQAWTNLLQRSFSETELPEWLKVAAALELGLLNLAEALARTATIEADLLLQWVETKRRTVPPTVTPLTTLVVPLAEHSLTETWKPSSRNGALIIQPSAFGQLGQEFQKRDIDVSVDVIAFELPNDDAAASSVIANIRPFLIPLLKKKLRDIVIFRDTEMVPPTPNIRPVVAPKGIDDLTENLSRFSPPSTALG